MCIVSMTPALKQRLGRVWAAPPGAGVETFIAHDAPDDAGWLFTEEHGKHFAGVSLWNIKTGENRRVHALADPQSLQGGGFDGRYLVWQESKWSKSFDLFSVYSFDLHTGKVTKLADSTRDAKGVTYPMQLADPVISDGMVAWAQGVGPGVSAVKLVDLRTGHLRTARQGPIGALHFVGDVLVIAELPGQGLHLVAIDVQSLKEVTLPASLAGVKNGDVFTASPGGKIAYIDETFRQLWFSNGPDTAPTLVAQLPAEFGFQGALQLSDSGLVFASEGRGSYFIDVSTGSALKITDSQYFFLRAAHVVTNDANGDKSAANTGLRIFDLAKGDIPACPRSPAPLRDLVSSTASTQPSVGAGA